MATPVADAYSAPSGAPVYAGRYAPGGRVTGSALLDSMLSTGGFDGGVPSGISGGATLAEMTAAGTVGTPAIAISGSNWTPNRDGSGVILQSDGPQMPLLTWYYVNDSQAKINNVIETPHLLSGGGSDGSISIVRAWGGMAFDRTNGIAYISGGGHSDGHPCETGVYKLALSNLNWQRIIGRQNTSQAQYWGGSALVAGVAYPDHNNPLISGVPASWHTYNGLEYIPPAGLGNTNGGLYLGANAKTVINLDDNSYKTTHWMADNVAGGVDDWSNGAAFYDSGSIWRPRAAFSWGRHLLSGTSSSSWSASSFGAYSLTFATAATNFVTGDKILIKMPERRELANISGNQAGVRVRVGQAVDAAATVWSSYHDAITLTSVNGTDHLDFNTTSLDDGSGALIDSAMSSAGAFYDHAVPCVWIQGNAVGGQLYKITGISTNTWTVEKIVGTGALTLARGHTYGRFVVGTVAGVKMAMRITTTTGYLEVMRLA